MSKLQFLPIVKEIVTQFWGFFGLFLAGPMSSWYWQHSLKKLVCSYYIGPNNNKWETPRILTSMHFSKNRRSTAPFYLNTYKTEVLCVKDVMVIAWFVVQFKATSFCFPYPGKAHVSHSMCTYHDSREHTNSLTQIAETSTRSRGLSNTKLQKKKRI